MRHIVAHYHEIALKGGNRALFIRRLMQNIRVQLAGTSFYDVRHEEGRLIVACQEITPDIIERLRHVFGITSYGPVEMVASDLENITKAAVSRLRLLERGTTSFAVRTKRSNKQFPYTSEEINRLVGQSIKNVLGWTVDLENPEMTILIEITSQHALIGIERYPGPGGLPVGVSGKVIALLSGGIDSPVAAWKIMKRGAEVIFVHFHSYPHTNRASIRKTEELAQIVGAYQPNSKLHLIPFAEAQREIVMHTSPKYRVLLYRRLMVRIAGEIAKQEGARAIVTGESLGQVASQTLENMAVIEEAASVPVLRPLVGDDKEEIISQAKKLGTYDISIQPHDDCCTLFVPKHPATNARLEDIIREELSLDIEKFIQEVSNQTTTAVVV